MSPKFTKIIVRIVKATYTKINGIIITGLSIIGKPKISGSPMLNSAAGRARAPSDLIRLDLDVNITAAIGASPVQM